MLWKLKRKSLIWLSNVLRNWSDSINEYLWNDKAEVSFQAVEQPLAPDACPNCGAKGGGHFAECILFNLYL